MGCSLGKYHEHFEPDSTVLGGDKYTLQLLKHLSFSSEDVDALFTAFKDMDADGCGVIRLDELLTYFDIKKTVLIERVFEDKSSKYPYFLNFEQFVILTWQFLVLPLDKVATFAFHLMDSKKTGSISQEQARYLLEMMHGQVYEESDKVRKFVKMCARHGERLSRDEFEKFSETHRFFCDPLRKTQIAYQSKLLGRPAWKRIRLAVKGNPEVFTDDFVAQKLLEKFRLERRLNTSLVELEKRTKEMEEKMEEMLDEDPEHVSHRCAAAHDIKLCDDNIIIPVEGKIRQPKSVALHKTPILISHSGDDQSKKRRKKKRAFIKRRNSLGEKNRRHSTDGSSAPLKSGDNRAVVIFKSSSLDMDGSGDDKDEECKTRGAENERSKSSEKHKEGAVVPFVVD